jgi:two-component system, chemotaxis family, chemotaxis protein CheY
LFPAGWLLKHELHKTVALRFLAVTAEPVVLVVEDEEPIRDVIRDVLEDNGYRVLRAKNGAEALAVLERQRPDAVVLDLLMPVMHGWDFMETYFDKTGGEPIPIVIVSVNPALPRSFNRFGVSQVLAKPFDVSELAEAVDAATHRTPTPCAG